MKFPLTLLKMEDFPDFEGDRKERLLRTLNGAFTAVSQIVNGGVGTDNLAAVVKEVSFSGEAVTFTVSLPGKRKPAHVIVTKATDKTSANGVESPIVSGVPAWSAASSKSGGYAITIHSVANYTAGHTQKLTLLILGA